MYFLRFSFLLFMFPIHSTFHAARYPIFISLPAPFVSIPPCFSLFLQHFLHPFTPDYPFLSYKILQTLSLLFTFFLSPCISCLAFVRPIFMERPKLNFVSNESRIIMNTKCINDALYCSKFPCRPSCANNNLLTDRLYIVLHVILHSI